jgi:hypothetical protein
MRFSLRGNGCFDLLWLVACGLLSSAWCVTAARELSATFDEPIYIKRGLHGWRDSSHQGLLRLGTMPLPIDVETLPLYLWERWHGTTLDPEKGLNQVLPWARAGTLFFWWLLLGYAMLTGRALAGSWGGRLAVALLASEPSFLAHASLATTDIALTACLVALFYHFHQGREAGWWRRIGIPALWFAAAVLSKASAIVYGPICMFVIETERLVRLRLNQEEDRESSSAKWWSPMVTILRWPFSAALAPFGRHLFAIMGIGMVLVFVYCGSDWRPQPSFVAWAHARAEGPSRNFMVWLAENLCIFSNAGEGIVRQIKHNLHGHGTYLLGQSHPRAFWYYFPVLLTIKLSIPLLLAPLAIGCVRPRTLINFAFLCAAVLLVCSLNFRVQIGIRMILPLVALGIIGLAAAGVQAWQDCEFRWQRAVAISVALGTILWSAQGAARVWPHGLCYTNELWGGTWNGYRHMSDANYDWGQGVKELARWQERTATEPLAVWLFGSDLTLSESRLRSLPLHVIPSQGPDDIAARVRGQHVAVSTTLLFGSTLNNPNHIHAAAFFRRHQPVNRTTTFFIYDFTGGTASSQPHVPSH